MDLHAVAHNIQRVHSLLRENSTLYKPHEVMAILKSNAYGLGMLEVAKTCLENNVRWFGVAKASEALELHHILNNEVLNDRTSVGKKLQSEISARQIFTWIWTPNDSVQELFDADITVSVGNLWQVEAVRKAVHARLADGSHVESDASHLGQKVSTLRIHLKVDTGSGRGGFCNDQTFLEALKILHDAESTGKIQVEGIWSHLVCADEASDDACMATKLQVDTFKTMLDLAKRAGLNPKFRHISASAGILQYPELYSEVSDELDGEPFFNMVRPGIILYGESPNPDTIDVRKFGFKPTVTLKSTLMSVKDVTSGQGISYGHTYHTKERTKIGIVPLGYADGISRACSGSDARIGAPVMVNGEIHTIAGRVCMDQFMLDLGANTCAKAGDEVILFGANANDPTVSDWAKAANTIPYEILTSLPQI